MSRFSGKQYKGALRELRERRYQEALDRQQRLIDEGSYPQMAAIGGGLVKVGLRLPAPIEKFLRTPAADLCD